MSNGNKFVVGLLAVLGFPIAIILSGFYFATITQILWNWFLPSVFGLPTVTILQAWGFALVVSMFHLRLRHSEHNSSAVEYIAFYVSPLFILGMGFIVKQFI